VCPRCPCFFWTCVLLPYVCKKNFASIAEPLSALTKKGVRCNWSPEAQQAFDRLKRALAETVTLAYRQPNQIFILDTDASDVAVGAILSTMVDGVERPIAFFSSIMNSSQRNYCPTRRELLAMIAGLQHFRHYLVGASVILRTDHYSLKWLKTFKRPEGIQARWIETLAEFDYTVEHRPDRLHSNADGLSGPFVSSVTTGLAKYLGSMKWRGQMPQSAPGPSTC